MTLGTFVAVCIGISLTSLSVGLLALVGLIVRDVIKGDL